MGYRTTDYTAPSSALRSSHTLHKNNAGGVAETYRPTFKVWRPHAVGPTHFVILQSHAYLYLLLLPRKRHRTTDNLLPHKLVRPRGPRDLYGIYLCAYDMKLFVGMIPGLKRIGFSKLFWFRRPTGAQTALVGYNLRWFIRESHSFFRVHQSTNVEY